ncbi:unnamed protein product [Plutella xylostella]|uniref:(diamondback moth) hypothetical protein n=1 Tax=Plutella xylostella TaxID=51655 RepID=A0A8S4EKI9_PLUXY|nr:unnamed protein product [Plutella xylostella]
MSKLKRTPPHSPLTLQHAGSEPNLNKCTTPDPIEKNMLNIICRNKRKHDDDQTSLLTEMKNMFTQWQKIQDKKFESLLSTVKDIKEQNVSIQASVEFISKQYDDLLERMNHLELERKANMSHIQSLEDKIDYLERALRSSSIEIRNASLDKQESKIDLINTVRKIGETINVPIQPSDLRDVFKMSTKSDSKPIIAEFTSVLTKEKFLQSYKSFNKERKDKLNTSCVHPAMPPKPVFISESLTPKLKKLHFLARDYAKTNAYDYCWINNGKIFLRKKEGTPYIRITTEQDLSKLKSANN